MKKLVIYPGRFQPFHKGHAQVFNWLKNKFGDAIIATSDKVEAPKSPFNFKEKKQMMKLAGVPASKVKQVLNPYLAREILKDYDPKTTVLIFAVSQKDMEEDPRFTFLTKKGKPGYLQRYDEHENNLKPFGDVQKMKGYVIVTPTFTFNVLGKPATSASELRKQFVLLDSKKQKEFITDLFGKYDADIHKLMKTKIGAMMKQPKTLKQIKEEVTRKELAPMLDSFVSFASKKLGLKSMPNIRYKTDKDGYNSFAAYNPSSNELSVHTMNRHPMDIFRSVAHELVHHKQNEDGKLGKDIEKEGATGSDIENEANSEAGKIMRWFAKANPDMFSKTYVVEEIANSASGGGVRGLGNVTGNPAFDDEEESNYMTQNLSDTETLKDRVDQLINKTTTDTFYTWKDNNWWMNSDDKKAYHAKTLKGIRNMAQSLNEGINDPGKLKAVFLAGGPGSGKDFVMNKALAGNGLREINSDTAFEFLMKKHGLDLEMPDEERVEREIVRGRAKGMTSKKELNSLAGRLGLIVNGTADDLEKIRTVKAELEDLGYDTMMVFVNTSNEVSRQRNVERGKMGMRKVPDGTDKQGTPDNSPNIRQEKWDLAQKNLSELEKIFGKEKFAVIDNTADLRKVTPDEKNRIEGEFTRIRRMTMQFVQSPVQNKRGKAWTERRARYQGTTQYTPPKAYTKPQAPARVEMPKAIVKPSSEIMNQARRLGLSYYGFGRFGRKIGGENKVLYHSKGNQLVKVQTMNEEKKKDINSKFEKYMIDPANREVGTDSVAKIYKTMTPGQEVKEDNVIPRGKFGLPKGGGLGPEFGIQVSPALVTGFANIGNAVYEASQSIQEWALNPKTQQKFAEKYGNLAEQKLIEAALKLEAAGCGCDHSKPKSVKKIKEMAWTAASSGKDPEDQMGTVPVQVKEEQLNERGADSKGLYRPTEKGAGLTRKGAKKFGVKTAVTTPPSKLDPKGKAAKRRKSFCARMSGMKGPMKDEKGRPTRKAMSLRRWNCEE